MQRRKPLTVNNSHKTLGQFFKRSVKTHRPVVRSEEAPSIPSYRGTGRQNSEGFGGGYRILRGGR